MSHPKKILVFTAARSDYFILRPLLKHLQDHPDTELQLVVSGMHMQKGFGDTVSLIEADGFEISAKMSMNDDTQPDRHLDVLKIMGSGLSVFGDTITNLNPDFVVVLGDRYEVMSFALASYVLGVPIAHLHGGELSFGAFDDAFRHCITKLSALHFTAAEEYAKRVIQMGEHPKTVHNVGALAVDNITAETTKDRPEVLKKLGIPENGAYFLVTVHPETKTNADLLRQADTLFEALQEFSGTHIVWTISNADPSGQALNKKLREYTYEKLHVVENLGKDYLPVLQHAQAIIGNSSSGIIEAPIVNTPTINIGHRQDGRKRCPSIIDCDFEKTNIVKQIEQALSKDFAEMIQNQNHGYGDYPVAPQIVELLLSTEVGKNPVKNFYDLKECTD